MIGEFTIPKHIKNEIYILVEREGLEDVDNYRAFRIKDLLGHAEYVKAYERGCCGFKDRIIYDKFGDQWVIGCNYGH